MKTLLFTICFLSCLGVETSNAQFTDLLNFNNADGANPYGSLTLSDNKLYGMTNEGGINSEGLVFSINTDGSSYKHLLDFNGTNGSYPYGSLTLLGNKLYGMTSYGGVKNFGCIFHIDTNGLNYKDIYDFDTTASNGANPYGSLIVSGGVLYGMTTGGGAYQDGCIFSIDTNGSRHQNLFSFNRTNGSTPNGDLTLSGSVLYGMTTGGGVGVCSNCGCIFRIDTTGNGFKDLFYFNGTNGSRPQGSLTVLGNKLYGMTSEGGVPTDGNIFSFNTRDSIFTDLLDFNFTDGAFPYGSLIYSGNKLYGMAKGGGAYKDGCIFSIDTNGNNYADLYDFVGTMNNGAFPYGDLTLSGNKFYGMTNEGNGYYGIIFSFQDTTIKTGTNALKNNSELVNIYPNPTNGEFTISPLMASENAEIDVYSMTGEKVYTSEVNHNLTEIGIGSLPAGLYLYKVVTNTGQLISSGKIVLDK